MSPTSPSTPISPSISRGLTFFLPLLILSHTVTSTALSPPVDSPPPSPISSSLSSPFTLSLPSPLFNYPGLRSEASLVQQYKACKKLIDGWRATIQQDEEAWKAGRHARNHSNHNHHRSHTTSSYSRALPRPPHSDNEDPFQDIIVAIPLDLLPREALPEHHTAADSLRGAKFFLHPIRPSSSPSSTAITPREQESNIPITEDKGFVVYALGNDNKIKFETSAAAMGAEVYSFDCTVEENRAWRNIFVFKPWCIGSTNSLRSQTMTNIYTRNARKRAASHRNHEPPAQQERSPMNMTISTFSPHSPDASSPFTFKTLAETKAYFGHKRAHILKFDIEGWEWELLENEIISPAEAYAHTNSADNSTASPTPSLPATSLHHESHDLPDQLIFELHTQGANPRYVPRSLVRGKKRKAVVKLMLKLWQLGYRVVHKEINRHDSKCMDVTMLRVGKRKEMHVEGGAKRLRRR